MAFALRNRVLLQGVLQTLDNTGNGRVGFGCMWLLLLLACISDIQLTLHYMRTGVDHSLVELGQSLVLDRERAWRLVDEYLAHSSYKVWPWTSMHDFHCHCTLPYICSIRTVLTNAGSNLPCLSFKYANSYA
jgi:hypothetical protein